MTLMEYFFRGRHHSLEYGPSNKKKGYSILWVFYLVVVRFGKMKIIPNWGFIPYYGMPNYDVRLYLPPQDSVKKPQLLNRLKIHWE